MQQNLSPEAIILLDTPISVIEIKMLKAHKSHNYLRDTRTHGAPSVAVQLSLYLFIAILLSPSFCVCVQELHKQITIIF